MFLLQGNSHFFLVGFFVLVSGRGILGLVSVSCSPCLRLVDLSSVSYSPCVGSVDFGFSFCVLLFMSRVSGFQVQFLWSTIHV